MHLLSRSIALAATSILTSLLTHTAAQTYTSCNPLTETCPADPALGKSVTIDFTSGASDSFTPSGEPTYGPNGAEFTVAKSGDSPLIKSDWYIMFGHVDYVVQAAPGVGIVSSAVMQSDDLDEIDWEWLGGDDTQAQTNYFGKGLTTTYNRGTYVAVANNHDEFHTYSVDWTADQIVWSIDGVSVRVLTPADADTGQYPQTPMLIKVGSWSGGDPSNPPGTIAWAGGPTNYSAGPFTMYLKSIHVDDYSTGSSYSYSGTSGTWESIKSNGGQVNSGGSDTAASSTEASASTTFSTVNSISTSSTGNAAFALGGTTVTSTSASGYPWVIMSSATVEISGGTASAVTSISGLPSGWTVSSSGKVVPPSAAPQAFLSTSLQVLCSPASSSDSGLEVVTSFNEQGFPTLTTVNPAAATLAASYDSKGFPITSSDLLKCSTVTHVQSVTEQVPTAAGTTMVPASITSTSPTSPTSQTSSTDLATETQVVQAAPNGANQKQMNHAFGFVGAGLIGAALIA